jgi:hypothetical protein
MLQSTTGASAGSAYMTSGKGSFCIFTYLIIAALESVDLGGAIVTLFFTMMYAFCGYVHFDSKCLKHVS